MKRLFAGVCVMMVLFCTACGLQNDITVTTTTTTTTTTATNADAAESTTASSVPADEAAFSDAASTATTTTATTAVTTSKPLSIHTTARSSTETTATTRSTQKSTTTAKTTKTTRSTTAASTTVTNPPASAADYRQEVLRLVNVERAKEGVAPLAYFTDGQRAADVRAAEILNTFSHTRPNGESCFTVLDDLGYRYYTCGENIAKGYTTPAQVVEAWMNSQGHRRNILDPNFTHLAVGYGEGNCWVQLFITPANGG
jgi:uncharacterized protein YkwD